MGHFLSIQRLTKWLITLRKQKFPQPLL
uniref:Uncharacterized protein n=1 Tax=Rhizophora mucronata TaxID=61149 RepID=A0A2P2PIS7_RHIMU